MKAGDVLKGGDPSLSAQNFLIQEAKNLDNLSDEELETLYNKLKEEQDLLNQGLMIWTDKNLLMKLEGYKKPKLNFL
jgi:hypothetical protein